MKKSYQLITCLLLLCSDFSAQQLTDSLAGELKRAPNDKAKAELMNMLASEWVKTDPGKAMSYAKAALTKAENINDKKITADALFNIGLSNDYLSNYDTALQYHKRALAIREKMGDNKGISQSCNNIGIINQLTGNYDEAIKYFERSIETGIKNKDKKNAAKALNNMGVIYERLGKLDKATDVYLKALAFSEETHDKHLAGMILVNLGLIQYQLDNFKGAHAYYRRAEILQKETNDLRGLSTTYTNLAGLYLRVKPDSAQYYFELAFKLYEKISDKFGMATALANIGTLKYNKKNYALAIDYYLQTLALREQIGDKLGTAFICKNIGQAYARLMQFDQAQKYFERALTIGKELQAKVLIKEVYADFGGMYAEKKDYLRAYEYQQRYTAIKDTLFNDEIAKQMSEMNTKYETEKKEGEIKLLNKDKDAQQQKQKFILLGLVLVLVLAGVLAYGFYNKRRANILLWKQKNIIQEQKQEVEKQKELVEEHQKEIIDSITYAKRLQQAILPSQEEINKYLPQNFLLYKPKDIVAGDFYWMHASDNNEIIFFAAADSTGHGVPGAMVSVVCSNALNRAVKEFKLEETGKILDKTRELVLETFSKSSADVKDGMDISLLAIDKAKKIISWSGANNQLWYITRNEFKEITADKQPIGKTDDPKLFTTHLIDYNPGDIFYLMTDGYPDQFGGPKGKKYKYKQLQDKLTSINHQDPKEQKKYLENSFDDWQGELEQVDDVTIVGIRI